MRCFGVKCSLTAQQKGSFLLISLIVIICLVLFFVAIGGLLVVLLLSKQGQGVSNARRNWIEGTGYQEEE